VTKRAKLEEDEEGGEDEEHSIELMFRNGARLGGLKQSTFCMARRKTMITMGSPYFVWINTNDIISSRYLLGAVCVPPLPGSFRTASSDSVAGQR
jgi:hypothetical protein